MPACSIKPSSHLLWPLISLSSLEISQHYFFQIGFQCLALSLLSFQYPYDEIAGTLDINPEASILILLYSLLFFFCFYQFFWYFIL